MWGQMCMHGCLSQRPLRDQQPLPTTTGARARCVQSWHFMLSISLPSLYCRCVRPLRTVYSLLEERGALALLDDPLMEQVGNTCVSG